MSNSKEDRGSGPALELDDEVAALLDEERSAHAGEDTVEEARRDTSSNGASPSAAAAVLGADDVERYRERWTRVQTEFIDDPRRSVEQADHLVDLVIQRLVDRLTAERDDLVRRWDGQDDPSTEDMRVALQGYRKVMDRLLAL